MNKITPENQLDLPFAYPSSENGRHNPVTTDEISVRFTDVFRFYQNRSKKSYWLDRTDISFYPYRSLKHTLRFRDSFAQVKISHFAANQPIEYFESLAHRLWSDLFRLKCPEEYRRSFDDMEKRLERRIRGTALFSSGKKNTDSRGSVYDLDCILKSIIREYGFGLINGITIGWSPKQARRRLGYYDAHSKAIVISGIFDRADVPAYVVEYIVYHELLHHIIPFEKSGINKKYHGAFFKRYEQKYRDYARADQWLKKEYPEWLKRLPKSQEKSR